MAGSSEIDQSSPNEVEVWTTPEVGSKLGINSDQLRRLRDRNKLPHTIKEYTILRWVGKQKESPHSSLWEVKPSN